MPTYIKSELVWLEQHAEKSAGGSMKCKTTGAEIKTAEVGRSIWTRPFCGGSGEVRTVTHLACSGCTPNKVPPNHGAPIYEDDLVAQS